MLWPSDPISQYNIACKLRVAENASCFYSGVYTFRRIRSTFEVQMEVIGAFTVIDTTAIVLRAVLPLMAWSQATITNFIPFCDFPPIGNGCLTPVLAWGYLVRSMADSTLGCGFSGDVVNFSSLMLVFLWLDIIFCLFLSSLLNFFDVHTINNLLL